jgi:hypothetical protein
MLYMLEVHGLTAEVRVAGMVRRRLQLALAALVFALFGNLVIFDLVLALDMQLTLHINVGRVAIDSEVLCCQKLDA